MRVIALANIWGHPYIWGHSHKHVHRVAIVYHERRNELLGPLPITIGCAIGRGSLAEYACHAAHPISVEERLWKGR